MAMPTHGGIDQPARNSWVKFVKQVKMTLTCYSRHFLFQGVLKVVHA